jgi:hypothetical protein
MFICKLNFASSAVVACGILVAVVGNGSALVRADQDKPTADPVKSVKPGEKPAKPDKPGDPNVKKLPVFSGTVKSVDAAAGAVTITATKGDQKVERTFAVAKNVKVAIDGKEAKLADLKAGTRVSVKLGEDRSTAVAIATENANPDVKKAAGASGTLKSVDAAKGTITIAATKRDASIDRTYTIAKNVKVVVDGSEGTLADLKNGFHVNVKLGDDKTTAVAVGCEGPTLVGEFKSVAADKKSVLIAVKVLADKTDKSSAKVEEKSVKIGDDLRVVIDGQKKASLADLKVGSNVAVRISADGARAIAISSPGKRADGDVKKPVKPGAAPTKPVKPGTDPVRPVKPGVNKPAKR